MSAAIDHLLYCIQIIPNHTIMHILQTFPNRVAKMTQSTPSDGVHSRDSIVKRPHTDKIRKRDHHVRFISSSVVEYRLNLPSNVRIGAHSAIQFSFHTIYTSSQLACFETKWRQEWIARGNLEYESLNLDQHIIEPLYSLVLFNWVQFQASLLRFVHLLTACNVSLPKVTKLDVVSHATILEQEKKRQLPEYLCKNAVVDDMDRLAIRQQLMRTFMLRDENEAIIDFVWCTSRQVEQMQSDIDILSMELRFEQIPSVFGAEGYAFGRKWLSVPRFLDILSVQDLMLLVRERDISFPTKSIDLISKSSIKVKNDELVAIHESFAGKPLKLLSLKELKMEAHLRKLVPKEKNAQHISCNQMNKLKSGNAPEKRNNKRGLKKRNKNAWIKLLHPEMKREIVLSKQYELLHAKLCHALENSLEQELANRKKTELSKLIVSIWKKPD
uniref:AlNc14C499G11939 protein n=1 Tax=Albugo laibachii Nc14 TaxID=890382 RepID=F0X0J4_9STRA|nr:AlNc14C499G11939 [Albugo laibachii Nc14]|eukprot:CCA27285.1 AlNc14C499G11939 [Albugo laibachii Nc14]